MKINVFGGILMHSWWTWFPENLSPLKRPLETCFFLRFDASICKTKNAVSVDLQRFASFCFLSQRREGDSNPWNPFEVYTLSRRASSTTPAPLQRWHGRSDSNARHSVLETDALPTELHPCFFDCECKSRTIFYMYKSFDKKMNHSLVVLFIGFQSLFVVHWEWVWSVNVAVFSLFSVFYQYRAVVGQRVISMSVVHVYI